MIDVVSQRTVQNFGLDPNGENLIWAQHQIRYKALVELGWDGDGIVFDHNTKTEHDDFDTPHTIYLIKRGEQGKVQGVVRINPTTHPFMLLKPTFNDMAPGGVPKGPKIWEGSRIAFDPTIDKPTRRRSIAELSLAKAELIHEMGIDRLVGMMPERFWNSVFRGTGWEAKPLGQEVIFPDKSTAQACEYTIGEQAKMELRVRLGVRGSILNKSDFDEEPEIETPAAQPAAAIIA